MEKKIEELISECLKLGFNPNQISQIAHGIIQRLDVSKYANLKYNGKQMKEIRLGLIKGQLLQAAPPSSLSEHEQAGFAPCLSIQSKGGSFPLFPCRQHAGSQ